MQRLNRSAEGSSQAELGHHTRPASTVPAASFVRPLASVMQVTAVAPVLPGIMVMPGILVSVRNLTEGRLAAAENVGIIDLKDPNRGPLAAADPDLWHQFAQEFAGSQLSAALGEFDEAFSLASRVPESFCFAKAGPVGAHDVRALTEAWHRLRELLPTSVELVAVAYADHEAARTLPGEQIFQAAKEMNIRTWLLDTYTKNGLSSLDCGGLDRIKQIASQAKEASARFALAGSITLPIAQQCVAAQVVPNWFAVRGDVCQQGRSSCLEQAKLRRWTDWLHRPEVSSSLHEMESSWKR